MLTTFLVVSSLFLLLVIIVECDEQDHWQPLVKILGIIFIIGALCLLGHTLKHWDELRTGVKTVTQTIEKSVPVSTTINQQEIKHLSGVTIINRWYTPDKSCANDSFQCAPTGEYQVMDKDNNIKVLNFSCNQPVPDIRRGSVVDIDYIDESANSEYRCSNEYFLNAKIVEESK